MLMSNVAQMWRVLVFPSCSTSRTRREGPSVAPPFSIPSMALAFSSAADHVFFVLALTHTCSLHHRAVRIDVVSVADVR